MLVTSPLAHASFVLYRFSSIYQTFVLSISEYYEDEYSQCLRVYTCFFFKKDFVPTAMLKKVPRFLIYFDFFSSSNPLRLAATCEYLLHETGRHWVYACKSKTMVMMKDWIKPKCGISTPRVSYKSRALLSPSALIAAPHPKQFKIVGINVWQPPVSKRQPKDR